MQPQFMQDWIQELLLKNGLSKPDGRPLYAYRVTDESFAQLFELLRNKTNIGPNLAARRTSYFAQGWLFYAAEWWKRSYEGGAWSWSPIFKKLKYDDPDAMSRTDWVETASAYWKLADVAIGGKKHIGKVVVNGGLPLNLIQKADGSVSRLLHAVLNEAMLSSTALTSAQVKSQIELQKGYLPKSYRQDMVYELLEKVVSTVLELKEKLTNLGQQDPIIHLDKFHPDWMDEFPLRIDPDSARRLLGKLIRQAVTGNRKSKQPFSIVRQIRFSEDCSDWEYECLFDASSRHPVSSIAAMLDLSEDTLPASLDMVIVSGNTSVTIGQMQRRGDDYLIKLKHPQLSSEIFHRSVRLNVSRLGQLLGSLDLQGSEGPDPLVPWMLEDSLPCAKLLWAGSHKVSAASILLLTPENSQLISNANNVNPVIAANGKKIYRMTGGKVDVVVESESYQIECATQEKDLAEGIVWGNNRLLLDSSPSHIFLGTPKLDRVNSEGTRRSVPGSELFWRCNNVDSSAENIRQFGVGTLFWRKQGKTLLRLKAVCLPNAQQNKIGSHIEYVFDSDPIPKGTIRLKGWPVASVICTTENIYLKATNINDQWELLFISKINPPPLTLSLTMTWPSGALQKISLPFPIEGAFIVDNANATISRNAIISLKQSNYLTVHLRGMQNRPWKIRMRLENVTEKQGIPDLLVKFRPTIGISNQEIRLYDLQHQIQQLLSLTNELDAYVRISFEYGDNVKSSIIIARYSHDLKRRKNNGWVALDDGAGNNLSLEQLEQSGLRASSILDAEQDALILNPIFSQETHVGSWDFEPNSKEPGLWFIYPPPDSIINARPITWLIQETTATPDNTLAGLKLAMNVVSRDERLAALVEAFKTLAEEPNHEDWKYVQVCVDKFGHLPLASFDLWVAMSQFPRAVVCAFLSLEDFSEKIADRICNELPFEWIFTSPQDWLAVITKLNQTLTDQGANEREIRSLKSDLEKRLIWIQDRCPALHFSVQIGLIKGVGIKPSKDELQMLRMLGDIWLPGLLIGDNSDAANFLRRVAQNDAFDQSPPAQLKSRITQFSQEDSGRRLMAKFKSDVGDLKYSLVVAPMMIAYSVANDEACTWLEKTDLIFALRQYREFDPIWFDECYKVAMACAYSEGLIKV